MKPVFLGADHAGFRLKEQVRRALAKKGIPAVDLGAFSEERSDYPDFAAAVARRVARGEGSGILCCGSGLGMAMAANKVRGIRAAPVSDALGAELARSHNDANVLCLGGRTLPLARLPAILHAWLATPFEAGRHARRVRKIAALERRA